MEELKFKDNYVFLCIEGYTVNPEHVRFASSSPLFSWNNQKYGNEQFHWGCQKFLYPNNSFWLTELCYTRGNTPYQLHVPGAYLNLTRGSTSYQEFKNSWMFTHNKYIFHKDEIEPQDKVQKFLKNIINEDTVVFYKGKDYVKIIAELCGAKNAVNIENLGILKNPDFSKGSLETPHCKVHQTNYQYCTEQFFKYYMLKYPEWMLAYEDLVLKSSNQNTAKTNFEIEEGEIIDDVEYIAQGTNMRSGLDIHGKLDYER